MPCDGNSTRYCTHLLLRPCESVTLKIILLQLTSDLSEPLAPLLPRAHSLSSLHPSEEGEELHGLRQPIPRHHSYLFHEKSRDSINGGSDSNIQISSSDLSTQISSSSTSSSSSINGDLRRNQVSLDNNLQHSDGKKSPQKTQARTGCRSKVSSKDEVISDFPSGTGIAESESDSGRRTQTRSVKKTSPTPLPDADTDRASSIARKPRSIKKGSVTSESKKRALKEDEESPPLPVTREKRVRTMPSKLSD
jgi:hypothetical protein